MNLRRNGRRSVIVGTGAATLTAAALALGPGTAVAEPTDPADEITQAVEEAVDAARQAAEDAAQSAEDAARAAQDAAAQATKAAEDAAAAAGDSMEDSGDSGDIDATPDQVDWIPQDLQEDLENLQDMSGDERAEELEQILQDAVTGDYGEEVENWAERMTDFMDVLPQDLQSDLQNVIGMEGEAAQEQLQQVWQGVLDGEYGEDVEMWGTFLQRSFQQWNLGDIIEGSTEAGSSTD